ncbi:hypothetical protein NK6_4179 [Bradyrhizobium diazoefficiens]|uniref:Uncharacterized protein n=1 Tax=Bradyrhizobium diazoefficiens TaxID=1355477 RepID=A0A0E4BQ29_9BRAD|nr:hypothetical protein NK6_4179 [Bradyrhizobium diazoefficiens]
MPGKAVRPARGDGGLGRCLDLGHSILIISRPYGASSLPLPACGERSDCIGDAIRVRGYRSLDHLACGERPLTPTLSP